jgi:hypothetical protein
MTNRRDFVKNSSLALLLGGLGHKSIPPDIVNDGTPTLFADEPIVRDRLNQGPFEIDQDQGWIELGITSPSNKHIRNYGLGLVGYCWEENGPSLPVRLGKETLEQSIEKLASLPFMDVLYIRCDWRVVQNAPGKLNLSPVWKLTFEAAKQYGLRVGFRVQLSSPNFQPGQLALPDFLQKKIPLVKIGNRTGTNGEKKPDWEFIEPRYDHPEFQKAFRELNDLLAEEYNGHPQIEFMDMMMYGFWGEGHTSSLPNPFPDYLTAVNTTLDMTRYQVEKWNRVPLVMNTQPDISKTGNRECLDFAMRSGCWLRSDSLTRIEEPIQIDQLANRPPWLAVAMEHGEYRHYEPEDSLPDKTGINPIECSMLHVLDVGANYWALWTEADNLRLYNEKYPDVFSNLQKRIGYRLRPSWVWQRKRYGTSEIILAIANDGVAGVPGVLKIKLECPERKFSMSGSLDSGHPYGGKIRQCGFILPHGLEGLIMNLYAEIEIKGVMRPVAWACAQPLNPDGSFAIQLRNFEDPGWRKGV